MTGDRAHDAVAAVNVATGNDAPGAAGIARNVAGIEISAIKQMAMRAARVPGAASLAWGLPSFRTPAHVREAIKNALDSDPDLGKYALPDGLPELRRRAADRHHAITAVAVDPNDNVLITAGNMQGLNALFHTLLDAGDEVIVTDPGFASHVQQIRLCGGVPVFWALDEAAGWALDVERLPALITSRTKALVLVSPSNPTGRIFPKAALRRVGDVARAHGIRILIDDPYSEFCYENHARCFNLASVPDLTDTVVYLYTFSKVHAMSGWRLGYAIMPPALKQQVLKVHDATLICAPRPSQAAGIAALAGGSAHVREFEAVLGARRDRICERLDRLGHVFSYVRPQGAYYVFPRILAEHRDSVSFCTRLLDEARVSLTPGAAFGPGGAHHVRMAFCVDEDTIDTAFDRIERLFPG
jgi:aspartate/methionine/tyrosine aminotransferase